MRYFIGSLELLLRKNSYILCKGDYYRDYRCNQTPKGLKKGCQFIYWLKTHSTLPVCATYAVSLSWFGIKRRHNMVMMPVLNMHLKLIVTVMQRGPVRIVWRSVCCVEIVSWAMIVIVAVTYGWRVGEAGIMTWYAWLRAAGWMVPVRRVAAGCVTYTVARGVLTAPSKAMKICRASMMAIVEKCTCCASVEIAWLCSESDVTAYAKGCVFCKEDIRQCVHKFIIVVCHRWYWNAPKKLFWYSLKLKIAIFFKILNMKL